MRVAPACFRLNEAESRAFWRMSEKKITANPSPNPPSKPLKPEPAGDGFPLDKDVSIPPPGSDAAEEEGDDEIVDQR